MVEESKLAEKLEEKQSEVKFTEEEMTKLVEIRDKYVDVQQQFGQSAIMKLRLEERVKGLNNRVDELKEMYRAIQKTEQDFLDEINKKYGEGELNPETGVFIPNKS
jgi:hypothetical protein